PFGDEPLQFGNFGQAIADVGFDRQWGTWLFVRYLANSLIVAIAVVLGVLTTSILAAYVFAQMKIPGAGILFTLVLATIMVPPDLVLVPKVVLMFNLGWYNTYWALTVPFMVSVFGIFLLRQFFRQIPKELFEAAKMDGVGHLRYLFWIVIPLS